jgi:hypothetical protein
MYQVTHIFAVTQYLYFFVLISRQKKAIFFAPY